MKGKTARSNRSKGCGVAASLLLLAAPACHPHPETSFDAQQPRTAAVRNIGNFGEALRCMDDMLAAHGKRDIYITTAGIPDATGLIATGTKEMFISAVSRMSAPDDFVPARSAVEVPPAGSGAFSIRFEKAGAPERVACLAADREVGLLPPPELKRQDLERLPVRTLDEVVARFRGIAGVRVNEATLAIEVTR